jgi:hypothetical protein
MSNNDDQTSDLTENPKPFGDALAAVDDILANDDLSPDLNDLQATAYAIVKARADDFDEKIKNGACIKKLARKLSEATGCKINPKTLGAYIRRFRSRLDENEAAKQTVTGGIDGGMVPLSNRRSDLVSPPPKDPSTERTLLPGKPINNNPPSI